MIKRTGMLLACFAVAAGFFTVVLWGLQSGVAAGKYGAATRVETPGLYWFFIAGLVAMALIFLAAGIKAVIPAFPSRWLVIPALGLLLPLGLWGIGELTGIFWKMIVGVPDLSGRLIYAGLAIMLLGVVATLLYTLIWPEVRGLLSGRNHPDD
jgi:hypothetical protein